MLTHADAMQFLASRIDYERMKSMPCSEAAMKLDRMRDLLHRLGDPHLEIPTIHVAGTKGKGSTSAMIAAVLSAAGYRTGLYTSPHIERVEERMAVDGRSCSPDEFAALVEAVRPAVEAMDRETTELGPTYFEILTAMAFMHFLRQKADAVVLEVGLGGRLDATNVCRPCISVITSISLDHTKQLGETLAAIALEKAGIIKPGIPVISGVTLDAPREVIRRVAEERGCRIVELGVDFSFDYHAPKHLEQERLATATTRCNHGGVGWVERSEPHQDFSNDVVGLAALDPPYNSIATFDFHFSTKNSRRSTTSGTSDVENLDSPTSLTRLALGLLGRHQAANAAVALAAVEELRRQGWAIPEAAVRRGLAEVRWPARVEIVARRPAVVLDAAHNAASIAALLEVIEESFSVSRRFLIFATTQEKDIQGMLSLLVGRFDRILFTRYANSPRSVLPEELLALAEKIGSGHILNSTLSIAPTAPDAWLEINKLAKPDDLICITGSFFLASEMRSLIE